MFARFVGNAFAFGGLLLAGAVSVHALDPATQIDNFGSPETRTVIYADFASTTVAGHFSEPTRTFTGMASAVKYHPLIFSNPANDGACYDITTASADVFPSVNVDTRIWFDYPAGRQDRILNDDWAGSVFARGRVYISGNGQVLNVNVAAFSTTYNGSQFKILVRRLNQDEASCTTGSGFKWVKNISGSITNG
jgi:hypothetical protein